MGPWGPSPGSRDSRCRKGWRWRHSGLLGGKCDAAPSVGGEGGGVAAEPHRPEDGGFFYA